MKIKISIVSIIFPFFLFAQSEKDKNENNIIIEGNAEIVSDFIWRGSSFAGEALSRRNGTPYQSFASAPAFQPTIDIFSSDKKFQFSLFGNFQLNNRSDVDSDKKLFQSSPGGVGPSYLAESTTSYDPFNQDPCVQSLQNGMNGGSVPNNTCLYLYGSGNISQKKEPNGMRRSDGMFFSLIYNFDLSRYGQISVGIWFYNTFHKSSGNIMSPNTQKSNGFVSGGPNNNYNTNNPDAIGRLTWHEYFLIWKLPFAKIFDPTFSYYTQYSTENSGLFTGKNYISLNGKYTFREDKFFKITPQVNIGYVMSNNTIDNRSGIQDITTSTTFYFGDLFLKFAHIFRPDLYLWDTNNYFGYAGGDPNFASWNRSSSDGLVVDPSKIYGSQNGQILSAINSIDVGDVQTNNLIHIWLREKYTLQKIPAHLFYVSIGYTKIF
ncbi:hypothetical protein P3G55_05295 [Leptospira sp. 96542]|nr:hypothetical protein [Leptospira sp. 96542]